MSNSAKSAYYVSWHVAHTQVVFVSFPHLALFLIAISQNSQQNDLILYFGASLTLTRRSGRIKPVISDKMIRNEKIEGGG